jgi:NADP-reducing hydrogenase subunit HndC
MVDLARYFLEFLKEESCGKCVPCREGIDRSLEVLRRICAGGGTPDDIPLLEELATTIKDFSLCGLGQTAPNPLLSTIRHFRDEYEAHINEKKCPAYVCKELTFYYIDPDKCKACMICLRKCPTGGIVGGKYRIHVIDQEKCTHCGTCFEVCPSRFAAVIRLSGEPVPSPIPEEARILSHRE